MPVSVRPDPPPLKAPATRPPLTLHPENGALKIRHGRPRLAYPLWLQLRADFAALVRIAVHVDI
jgi:hypothetical protein